MAINSFRNDYHALVTKEAAVIDEAAIKTELI